MTETETPGYKQIYVRSTPRYIYFRSFRVVVILCTVKSEFYPFFYVHRALVHGLSGTSSWLYLR